MSPFLLQKTKAHFRFLSYLINMGGMRSLKGTLFFGNAHLQYCYCETVLDLYSILDS